MVKPNINSDRDNGIRGELLIQIDNQDKLTEIKKIEKTVANVKGNPPAQSMWSTGRNCPKCKGLLKIKELNPDTETLWVFCGECGAEFCHDDLENTSDIGDQLHRAIPDDMVLRWMEAREKELVRRGE